MYKLSSKASAGKTKYPIREQEAKMGLVTNRHIKAGLKSH